MNKVMTGMGAAALALALALTGCGKKEPAAETQVEEGATIQEQVTSVIEEKTAEEPEDSPALSEDFTTFETSYLTMGVAPGWTADPDGLAEEDANIELGEAYIAKGLELADDTTGTRLLVMVYNAAEFPDPFEEPQVSDYITSVDRADPVTVGGVELNGYLTSTSTGNEVAEWLGSVNGHFVDILVVDRSEGAVQRTSDTVMSMIESVTIK